MRKVLPSTGTQELLELLCDYIPDDFINQEWSRRSSHGKRYAFEASQLWRVHLLSLLTPVHSLNLLVKLLKENRHWRKFAGLSHRHRVPDVRMLHEFRNRVGVAGLRRINEKIIIALLKPQIEREGTLALIDATDLPASCSGFKKRQQANTMPSMPHWEDAPSRLDKANAL